MTTHRCTEDLGITPPPTEPQDVVLVGAGMSSLYIAWRLLEEERKNPDLPKKKICILERLDRTGGRLDSDLIDFGDGNIVKEEQGGMRFTFHTMDNLMSLFLMLELVKDIAPFPMNSGGNNRLYFRGRAFTNEESSLDDYGIWSMLYDLDQCEQGINPRSIITTVFQRILAANPEFKERPDPRTPGFWQNFRLQCKWDGVPLYDWTLWNLLSCMGFSNECITMLYRLLGFNGTFLSEMNAGEAFQLLEDFPADPQFHTLTEGFSTLPNALVDSIEEGGKRIALKTTVQSVSRGEDGYRVKCVQEAADGVHTEYTVTGKKLILGLPRLALEKLFISSDAFNELSVAESGKLWNTLQATTNQSLLKINLYYDKPWWGNKLYTRDPVSFGPNFSDLPLGSVYPFYTVDDDLLAALEYQGWLAQSGATASAGIREKLDDINAAKYDRPAALTIYCDYLNINYWRGLQGNGPLFDSELQRHYNEQCTQTIYAASESVVEAATGLFKKLFDTHYVPRPAMTSARIWSGTSKIGAEPAEMVGYGVHQWGLHARDDEVMQALVEPLTDLYTCGEAYSDYQGWVEGALRSADLVLDKAFELEPIADVYRCEHEESPTPEPADAITAAYKVIADERIRARIDPDFDPGSEHCSVSAFLDEGYDIKLSYPDI